MSGRAAIGAVVLVLLAAGCARQADFGVSAMVRTDEVRAGVGVSQIKVDLAEILTP